MEQESLFHESLEDAIEATVVRLDKKRVAADLWTPAMTFDSAKSRLSACLNPDRNEKFTPTEIATIARWGKDKGFHYIAQFLARDLGYEIPKPINPEDEITKIQREFVECTKHLASMTERMEKIMKF